MDWKLMLKDLQTTFSLIILEVEVAAFSLFSSFSILLRSSASVFSFLAVPSSIAFLIFFNKSLRSVTSSSSALFLFRSVDELKWEEKMRQLPPSKIMIESDVT